MIGRDSRGHWVAQDQSGKRGGLFVDRAEALKFARAENGNRQSAVVMVSGVLELEMTGLTSVSQIRQTQDTPHKRQVA
jgi:hypothetical protein